MTDCTFVSNFSMSDDRAADRHDHMRYYHPTHVHLYGPSPYAYEQEGVEYIVPGSGGVRAPRPETQTRCTVCNIRPQDDMQGKPCN